MIGVIDLDRLGAMTGGNIILGTVDRNETMLGDLLLEASRRSRIQAGRMSAVPVGMPVVSSRADTGGDGHETAEQFRGGNAL